MDNFIVVKVADNLLQLAGVFAQDLLGFLCGIVDQAAGKLLMIVVATGDSITELEIAGYVPNTRR